MLGGNIISEVLWRNAFGEPVDLDSIDREYALNIYTMVVQRRVEAWYWLLTQAEVEKELRGDPLVQKLREVILEDHEKTPADIARAKRFNAKAQKLGIRHRAATR